MNDSEKPQFMQSLVLLFGCHNSAAGEHVPESYWRYLKPLPLWAIRRGINRAIKESTTPQFIPTAEQIRRYAEIFAKHPPTELPDVCGLLSDGAAATLPDDNPFERLAKKWEQDIASGIKPDAKEAAEMINKVARETEIT